MKPVHSAAILREDVLPALNLTVAETARANSASPGRCCIRSSPSARPSRGRWRCTLAVLLQWRWLLASYADDLRSVARRAEATRRIRKVPEHARSATSGAKKVAMSDQTKLNYVYRGSDVNQSMTRNCCSRH